MMKTSWKNRHTERIAAAVCTLGLAVVAMAQSPAGPQTAAPAGAQTTISAPQGYALRNSIDLGGSADSISGSKAMYNTMVNDHSGPRVLGQTFELRALPGNKKPMVDEATAFLSGFGGTTNNIARLDMARNKVFEFSGLFRRSRQYFDYDLLGNPNILSGITIPVGPSTAPTATFAWPQVKQSPEMYNTVRRMLDTDLTLLPQSKVSFRLGYSHGTMEGPTNSPAGYDIGSFSTLLVRDYERNGTDEYRLGIDWKPLPETRVSLEGVGNYYKNDSFLTLSPTSLMFAEADGTPVAIGGFDSQTPYGISSCSTASMGSAYTSSTSYTLLTANPLGGAPVLNPACDAITSYLRTQPTRIFTPTEMLRFQSSDIKHLTMTGAARYTLAAMKMNHYYDNTVGLDALTTGGVRQITYNGYAYGHRAVFAVDYSVVWKPLEKFSLSDTVNYENTQQPGAGYMPIATTLSTPTTAGSETINYSGALTTGNLVAMPHGTNAAIKPDFFGQTEFTNNLTAGYDILDNLSLSLTYRYGYHLIDRGSTHGTPIPTVDTCDPVCGTMTINQNTGLLSVAYRPMRNWDINGSAEIGYADNVISALAPRQTTQYKVRTRFHPAAWAVVSAAYNSVEHHNNTNNNAASVAATPIYTQGPLQHEDYNRTASFTAQLTPSEYYGLDISYGYNHVYNATYVCFTNGASATLAGTATLTSSGTPDTCSHITGFVGHEIDWHAKSFFDAPTQYASVAFMVSPVKQIHADLGYRITDVSGNQFFLDPRNVNGALNSNYQSPFVRLAWTLRPGLVWKGEYNYHNYAEGGPSGPQYCTNSSVANSTAVVVPCTSLSQATGLTEPTSGLTAARTYHANNVTLGLHYEF